MKKILFYLMQGEEMCAMHALMNAEQLMESCDVQIIFEGKSVTLPQKLEENKNPIYKTLKDKGAIAGVCKACSKMFDVLETNEQLGLNILDDMKNHAGIQKYIEEGYQVIEF